MSPETENTEFEMPTPSAPEMEAEGEENAAPFAGFESDPGLENPEIAAEGAETPAGSPPMEPISYRELNSTELQSAVETLLFLQHKPVSINKLREIINPEIAEDEYRTAVSNIMALYFDESRGIELVEVAGGFQFRTKSENKDIVRRLYQIAPMKLTNAMLEVLAIAAYNQPLTRETIDKIRGVDSSHLVRALLDKKMLRIAGKSDELGRPMIYATTKEFLELFGLRDLNALPSLRELEEMLPANEVGGDTSEEELLAKEMEGIVTESKPLEFNDLEIEDLEAHETQKIVSAEPAVQAQTDSDGRATRYGSTSLSEAQPGDLDLSPEAARRITPGQEGNA
ncbi:MAG: SMC-Scp complex subunit ScpB [Bdellovibrionota bacterium]